MKSLVFMTNLPQHFLSHTNNKYDNNHIWGIPADYSSVHCSWDIRSWSFPFNTITFPYRFSAASTNNT